MSDVPDLVIIEAPAEEAWALTQHIPEFEPAYPWEKWQERLRDRKSLVLVARTRDQAIGCKVGYFEDDHFYSWVGGVLPAYRRHGVAGRLADVQEQFLRKSGVRILKMKTRNRFREMLLFSIRRGFMITGVEPIGEESEWRITLIKNL